MIVLVAPYHSNVNRDAAFLGATRKIKLLLKSFSLKDSDLVLVNSAHDGCEHFGLKVRSIKIDGIELREITPPIYKSKKIGKLINIFQANKVLDQLTKLGRPEIIWFYNGYAFEMRFAKLASKRLSAKMILGFEDWHFARNRGGNPKPLLDYILWRLSAHVFHQTFAVNSFLGDKMRPFCPEINLLPGIVDPDIGKLAHSSPPFLNSSNEIVVGYFGGLTKEKGADLILQLIENAANNILFVVTGSGELEAEFVEISKKFGPKISYHGKVADSELPKLIGKCDVIVNPHQPNSRLMDGVFPFKIIEGIASGRLMISTRILGKGVETEISGVQICEANKESILKIIGSSKKIYESHKMAINQSRLNVINRYGYQNLAQIISNKYSNK